MAHIHVSFNKLGIALMPALLRGVNNACSTTRGELLVPWARLAVVQHHAFSFVDPSIGNDLPGCHMTCALYWWPIYLSFTCVFSLFFSHG